MQPIPSQPSATMIVKGLEIYKAFAVANGDDNNGNDNNNTTIFLQNKDSSNNKTKSYTH